MSVMAPPIADGYGPPAPVPVFQWEEEFAQLLDLYRERAPLRTFEVGTYYGGTLYHWLQNAPKGARVVSLDSYRVGVDNRHLYADWCPAGVEVVALEANSNDPMTLDLVRPYGPFDWVWIDAGHYYHEVVRDWSLYGPTCKRGGIVCFHDILPPSKQHPEIEVARLWAEIQEHHETVEIIANPEASWGGIGVVLL